MSTYFARTTHLFIAMLCVLIGTAHAVPLATVNENFNAGLPSGYTFNSYPSGSTVSVLSGVLTVAKALNTNATYLTNATYSGQIITVSADLTETGDAGASAVGIAIGNRGFVFFPGFAGGAFRVVETPTSSSVTTLISNTNMGFTPANTGVLHSMTVIADLVAGNFNITVDDGGSASTFNYIYSTGAFVSGPIGLIDIYQGVNTGMFDNLVVIQDVPVPEPSTFSLLSLGLIGIAIRKRRRRCLTE